MSRRNKLLSADDKRSTMPRAPKPGSTEASEGGPERGEPLLDDSPPMETAATEKNPPSALGGEYSPGDDVTPDGVKPSRRNVIESLPDPSEGNPKINPPRGDERNIV